MNVLLLHLDGKLPNLALMKLAACHRQLGDHVELRRIAVSCSEPKTLKKAIRNVEPRFGDPAWDRVYGSLIFEDTRPVAERAQKIYPNIRLGGTGWDFRAGQLLHRTDLGAAIDELAPDYSDYRTFDRSMGFTQRGCRLSCRFCVVPRKEGRITDAWSIEQIWRGDPWPREIILLDNDFFGGRFWKARIAELVTGKFKVCFCQGINARMLNDETAEAIASVDCRDTDMERKRIYTAWDGRKDERRLFAGLDALKRAGIKPDHMMVYMLIGEEAGETHADRDYRRQKLRDYGALPYPMPYVRHGELGRELRKFQSWVIQRVDLHTSWKDYWEKAGGEVRKLGPRRVSLPLFGEGES